MSRAILVSYYSPSIYMPLWERYYSPFFDHIERFQYLPTEWTDMICVDYINKKVKELLHKYDMVAIPDMDEFLVPDPDKYGNLGEYLDNFTGDGVRCVGYNVMEMPGALPLDIERKITDQREYWMRDSYFYDKPVITRVPIIYGNGLHKCDIEFPQDPDLVMLHLRDADLYQLCHGYGLHRDETFFEHIIERQKQATLIPEKWRVI